MCLSRLISRHSRPKNLFRHSKIKDTQISGDEVTYIGYFNRIEVDFDYSTIHRQLLWPKPTFLYTLGEPNPDSHSTKRVRIRLSQSVVWQHFGKNLYFGKFQCCRYTIHFEFLYFYLWSSYMILWLMIQIILKWW